MQVVSSVASPTLGIESATSPAERVVDVPRLLPSAAADETLDGDIERSVQLFADEHVRQDDSSLDPNAGNVAVVSHYDPDPGPDENEDEPDTGAIRLPTIHWREAGTLVPPTPSKL